MIKIQTIEIEEFRGIRKLNLALNGKNFAVCGRNGTGKSGIVDAIEFALTGNISRLSGEGTDKLSVRVHAPHVDSRDNPANARVRLTVTIPSLKNKMVVIERSPNEPRKPKIDSSDAAVLDVLRQVEEHPELVLTRREIIRYVLATEGKRSEEVQAVLKLENLNHIRSTLQTIANARVRDAKALGQSADSASTALRTALAIPKIAEAGVLSAVNARRKVLDLAELVALTATTSVKDGIARPAEHAKLNVVPKAAAVTDLQDLRAGIERLRNCTSDTAFKSALEISLELTADAEVLKTLSREDFLQTGLGFIDDAACPFCDDQWELAKLRDHVGAKLRSLEVVKARRAVAEKAIEPVGAMLGELDEVLARIIKYAQIAKPAMSSEALKLFRVAIEETKSSLEDFLPLADAITALQSPPLPSATGLKELDAIESYVRSLPEPSAADTAKEYLIVAQERLDAYRDARRAKVAADAQSDLATRIAKSFADTADAELTHLYRAVEKEFAGMYGTLNSPDEADFAATLVPSIGKLGFDVNFYGRGFFPPGAYHSEGHQDAMGLCLYLALMNYVLKGNFLFAVLDDVLMSVDAGHRRAVCTLLKSRFPNTQFILTTHDPVWLNHMRAEGLVSGRSLVHFRSWDVETGPAAWNDAEVWDEIEKELQHDRVPLAAALLRNYMEYVSGELCDRLHARVEYRLDGRIELGALLQPACQQLTDLYSKGKEAANSWNQVDIRKELVDRSDRLSAALKATGADQWQVNTAIHYNAWASLQKKDFEPVVASFRALVECFRCLDCGGLLAVLRDGPTNKSCSCNCGKCTFNLVLKEKG